MEIKPASLFRIQLVRFSRLLILLLLFSVQLKAQENPIYTVRDGKMLIEIKRQIKTSSLDSFITQYQLEELGLKDCIRLNNTDSLQKKGWTIEVNNDLRLVISKPLESFNIFNDPADKIIFTESQPTFAQRFPAINNGILYGINRFRNKLPFQVNDSSVVFFLRNHNKAGNVMLAGSFNNWDPNSMAMTRTDSGWIARVKLGPGKYWYKFIVDGNWIVDQDNLQKEPDGQGNINSIYYKPNVLFRLDSLMSEKRIFLAGSFNDWRKNELQMVKTARGWELPLYLSEGTHTYKFIADGNWFADPQNADLLPDGNGSYNSVISLGQPYFFHLNGFEHAKEVVLTGSFNNWRQDELYMKRTGNGWELPYVLGPGNYEYKFKVDGQWMTDPTNPYTTVKDGGEGNSFLIIQPNYTFLLKGFGKAKTVYLAGDFNNWQPYQLPMKKEGDDWKFTLHLNAGKVRYKFIVDDSWILDPRNKLWEQNEYGTGNSVIWIEK